MATAPSIASAPHTTLTPQRRAGAVLLLCSAALLLVGFALPWIVVMPLNDIAVSVIGPSAQSFGPGLFFARPLSQSLASLTLCFPEAPVLAALLLGVTGIAYLTRRRPPARLDLVVAACAIGLVSVGITVILIQPDLFHFYHFVPVYEYDFTWGLWLSLAAYPTAWIGCFLLRRRRGERVAAPIS